jgi:hypothetical protein
LLDVARFKGVDSLDDGYGITCKDLDDCAKAQKVEMKRGDYVIVRTGMMQRCQKLGSWDGYPGGDAPGFAFETLEWIKRTELAALASDTWGCEVRPNESEEGINQPWARSSSSRNWARTAPPTRPMSSCSSRRPSRSPAQSAHRSIRWRSSRTTELCRYYAANATSMP